MTAGRLFKEECPRCQQTVDWETTGFLYGPWAMPLKHNKPDGSLCAEKPVLIDHGLVELRPYDPPTTKLLDLEYRYGKPETESERLHLDWWGKCRTCVYWTGDRTRATAGSCGCDRSDMHGKETWTEGHCVKWDSYDIETALKVMQEDGRLPHPKPCATCGRVGCRPMNHAGWHPDDEGHG